MSIELDHTVVADAGTGIGSSADKVADALVRLRGTLDALGAPWGDDELGTRFGGEYTAVVTRAVTAISSYREQLDYAAGELSATAETLRAHSELNADQLRRVWSSPTGQ